MWLLDMYPEDAVFVGDYVFWDFAQKVSHIVYFQYRRLTEDGEADVQSEIVSLFEKMGLWEDYINIQKTVNEEVEGGPSQASNTFNNPKLFNIEFSKDKRPPICAIGYTRDESMRLSKGRLSQVNLNIEEVKNLLIGVNKWIILIKFRDLL